MTWPQCEDRPMVLVPVGSLEQHGPHLPLNTDTIVAHAVANGLAGRLASSRNCVVAPPVPYGASGEHQDFPGTTSIGTRALITVLVELARSLRVWASPVVFVNGHGGNRQALDAALKILLREGHNVQWVPCATADSDPHAGFAETSLMLHLNVANVRIHRAEAGNVAPLEELMFALRRGGVAAVSPNGVLGDPAGANALAGHRILQEMVDNAFAALQRREMNLDSQEAG